MNIIIHRGANQIGGCITEITTDGAKIFIDFGSNLPGSKKKELNPEQIADMTSGADAIFYTDENVLLMIDRFADVLYDLDGHDVVQILFSEVLFRRRKDALDAAG